MEIRRATFEEELALHGSFAITAIGRSMMPLLRENRDLLVIRRMPRGADGRPQRARRYDVVLYKREGRYILHRVLKVLPEGYVICGDNNWKREYDIYDAQILGVMTAFVRDGVETPVTDGRYKLYVHLWCDFYYIRAAVLMAIAALRRLKERAAGADR